MADSKLEKQNTKADDKMKEKKKKDKKAKSSEEETLAVDFPKKGEKNLKEHLLRSIAAFLESSGFHRTFTVFRSETEIENAGSPASFINLEDIFSRHFEYSDGPAASAIDCSKKNGDISRKDEDEGIRDASKHIHKKKRKHKNESDGEITPGTNEQGLEDNSINFKVKSTELGDAEDLKKFKTAEDLPAETKDNKRKKKSISGTHENAETDLSKHTCKTVQDTDIIVPKSDMKGEAKRKKKHKTTSDAGNGDTNHENHKISQEIVEEKIGELNSLMKSSSALPAETDAEHKAKKKQKKVASNLTAGNGNEEQVKSTSGKRNITISEEKLDNSEKHRKRKKAPEDGASLVENKTVTEESKHVKVERAEGNKKTGSLPTTEKSDCEPAALDEKKAEKSSEKESGGQQVANGDLEKKEEIGVSSANSTKKEKRSAETNEDRGNDVLQLFRRTDTRRTCALVDEHTATTIEMFTQAQTRYQTESDESGSSSQPDSYQFWGETIGIKMGQVNGLGSEASSFVPNGASQHQSPIQSKQDDELEQIRQRLTEYEEREVRIRQELETSRESEGRLRQMLESEERIRQMTEERRESDERLRQMIEARMESEERTRQLMASYEQRYQRLEQIVLARDDTARPGDSTDLPPRTSDLN